MAANSVLKPVAEPPETTTTTEAPVDKWAQFKVYKQYGSSRVGHSGAGFGAGYGKAAEANFELIPREYDRDRYSNNRITVNNPYFNPPQPQGGPTRYESLPHWRTTPRPRTTIRPRTTASPQPSQPSSSNQNSNTAFRRYYEINTNVVNKPPESM